MSRLNVDLLLKTLGEIMSEKHGVQVEFCAIKKEEPRNEKEQYQGTQPACG